MSFCCFVPKAREWLGVQGREGDLKETMLGACTGRKTGLRLPCVGQSMARGVPDVSECPSLTKAGYRSAPGFLVFVARTLLSQVAVTSLSRENHVTSVAVQCGPSDGASPRKCGIAGDRCWNILRRCRNERYVTRNALSHCSSSCSLLLVRCTWCPAWAGLCLEPRLFHSSLSEFSPFLCLLLGFGISCSSPDLSSITTALFIFTFRFQFWLFSLFVLSFPESFLFWARESFPVSPSQTHLLFLCLFQLILFCAAVPSTPAFLTRRTGRGLCVPCTYAPQYFTALSKIEVLFQRGVKDFFVRYCTGFFSF